MKITNHSFEVFERDSFIYRKNMPGAEKIKNEYTTAWNEWKKIVETSLLESYSHDLAIENTENWQNSGNLSTRFWTRIKDKNHFELPSCIAAMISKDNLRVYLEWHGYKNEALHEERKIHNNWIFSAKEWIKEQNINPSDYYVWTNKEEVEGFENYHTLFEFLNDSRVADQLKSELEEDNKNWIRVGRVFPKSTALHSDNFIAIMGQTIRELKWIYKIALRYSSKKEIIEEKEVPASVIREKPKVISTREIINHINSYIKSKGFLYSKEEVINLFLSLKTKPFVILSGISGTGKTKVVQWFSEAVGATEENGQFTLIPVRPDWNDSTDLLGYVDIKGEFKEGALTKVVKRATQHPELPYFVLLDEMNLARVEHYFSDILSVMESRKWQNGEVVSSTLLSKEIAGEALKLPNNLFIIGTVNMDETTHPFSKKVLDRANTIEFNRIELGNLSFLSDSEVVEPLEVDFAKFSPKYLHLKDVYQKNKDIVEQATAELVKINEVLQRINAHVGYRVRDEICFYLAYNEEGNLLSFDEALDYCILQKVLPRIAGSDGRVERLLKELYTLFTNREYVEDEISGDYFETAKYRQSAAKVYEMLRRFRDDGFTSFWIS